MLDPSKIKAAIEALKNEDGAAALALLEELIAGDAPAGDDPAALGENPAAPPEEQMLSVQLKKLTGCDTVDEALTSLASLKGRVDKLDSESAALDLERRRELVGELVKLGVEFPATAWAGKPEDRNPCKRLADEPLSELRSRVALHRAAPRVAVAPPDGEKPVEGDREVKTSHGMVTLSSREIKNCEASNVKIEAYAENKAIRESARRGRK